MGIQRERLSSPSEIQMSTDSDISARTIHKLKEELARLKDEQDEAMKKAVYLGMTPEEAKAVDERRRRIYRLYESLVALEHTKQY